MNPQDFGHLALQLLQQVNFPGRDEAIDAVVEFRACARALADGRAIIAATATTETQTEKE